MIDLLIGSSITFASMFTFIIFLFLNPDKFEHWMAIIHKGLYSLTSSIPKIQKKIDRLAVASSIQDSVNSICEEINMESPDVFPHALKIEWVQSESAESFIKKGKGIVRLNHYDNQSKNIVDSTLMYLKIGLLPHSKNYLDKTLRKCCEFKVAAQIFEGRRDTGAFDYFIENELDPTVSADANFKHVLQILEDIDSLGFFSRVFLNEVKHTGDKLLGTIPTTAVQKELQDFAVFLQTIANKDSDENVPLDFKGVKVKVAVVMVAKKDTIESYGVKPYINMISKKVRENFDSIYITGWGSEFSRKIIEIKNEVESKKLVTILRSYKYSIRSQIEGQLIVCQSNSNYLAQQRELQEEVKEAISEIVPEIKNGEIEIASIARIREVGCKIAVRMASGEDVNEATGACIGANGERVDALRKCLTKENIHIIPWSKNMREYIVNAIALREVNSIDKVEIDEENLVANVKINSKDNYRKALGRNHFNINLASDLTGWIINIEGPKKTRTMKTPIEELEKIISKRVHEIEDNEIEIVKIARIKGVVSRVIVKWKNEDATSNRLMASQVCRGRNNERSIAIQEHIKGEWIYFHEWVEDPKELIIGCLFPLNKFDVDSIELNYDLNIATVKLRKIMKSGPLWRDPNKLNLSERITGWNIEIVESAQNLNDM